MFKLSPNPPATPSISPYDALDPTRLNEAAERALDHHLGPKPDPQRFADTRPSALFSVSPDASNETLLANAYETLTSASVMAGDLAFDLEGSRRHVALAIQQMVELGQLLVNRALDLENPVH
ncbi:DUF6124 family protein [Pseudomonas fluorescens]|uniref:DUF3077 domain-containing protein n=1 Tax=Pseudomonas fluorescens TaxID=294 RepID=A0A5E7D9L5_PSEFL|nr:DUF6124 family protein [Pseudomonas fluorescens]VVO14219.1 hypothetical protein PS723_03670 [Pseudomonas fluorescens]